MSASNPRVELEKLGKRMMTIERDLSKLTEEIKGLQSKLAEAGENGVLVSFELDGFDEGARRSLIIFSSPHAPQPHEPLTQGPRHGVRCFFPRNFIFVCCRGDG